MSARLVVYRTPFARRNQRWRWKLIASNGRNIANSGEGYANRTACVAMAKAIVAGEYRDARPTPQ